MSESLGVVTWPDRVPPERQHRVSDFPVLRSQIRSEFGFRHVSGGVLRMAALGVSAAALANTVHAAAEAPGSNYGQRPAMMLAELHRLADLGQVLPSTSELGRIISPKLSPERWASAFSEVMKRLIAHGSVDMWVGDRVPGKLELPRAIRLRDGRVLRNSLAPKELRL
jgi:hypothetical protein